MQQNELSLTDEDRELIDMYRASSFRQDSKVNRAHILSALDRGVPDTQIMVVLGVVPAVISETRTAYLVGGVEHALQDISGFTKSPRYETGVKILMSNGATSDIPAAVTYVKNLTVQAVLTSLQEKPARLVGTLWILLIFAVLLAVYSPTFHYPYVLTDEAWIIRPNTSSWTLSMGRPFFSILGSASANLMASFGLDVIYAMRLSAVVGLSAASYFLMRWFEQWGHSRLASFAIAVAVMTLPAFQIVVADGTQLAVAIFFSVLATHLYFRPDRPVLFRAAIAATLLLAALLIYQQQILVAFAMLVVPLLRSKNVGRRAIEFAVLIASVSVVYFLLWKVIYNQLWPGKIDMRYGPEAVQLPGIEQLRNFLDVRLPQIASLWDVSPPSYGVIAVLVLGLVAVKVARDMREPKSAILTYVLLLGLLATSDGFSILARAYPSYVSATALSLLLFYLAYSSVETLSKRFAPPIVCFLAAIGCVSAFSTVKNEIAIPNWTHMQQIRHAIIDNPKKNNFYLLGTQSSDRRFKEFNWRNSATDVYLNLAAIDVADDLTKKGHVTPERRAAMYFGIGGLPETGPKSTPREKRPDAVVVQLEQL